MKQFTNNSVVTSWWKKKKYLAVSGGKASCVVHTLLSFIGENYNTSTNRKAFEEETKSSCPCRCGEIRADIEGTMLGLVITDTRIKANEVMIAEIRQANEVILSEIRQELKESLNKLENYQNRPRGDNVSVINNDDHNDEQPYQSQMKVISKLLSSLRTT